MEVEGVEASGQACGKAAYTQLCKEVDTKPWAEQSTLACWQDLEISPQKVAWSARSQFPESSINALHARNLTGSCAAFL